VEVGESIETYVKRVKIVYIMILIKAKPLLDGVVIFSVDLLLVKDYFFNVSE
jgi:hypothetical protein